MLDPILLSFHPVLQFSFEFVCPLGCGRHPITQSYRTVLVSIVRISELEMVVVTHPPSPGLPLWAAWSRLLLVPPSKYSASCAAWLSCYCVEGWWFLAFALLFSLWHQRPSPVWGVTTLYTTVIRFCVALRCRTEVFIIDVPGPPLDVH